MYAIASLLDPTADMNVRMLWERFEEHCGLSGIRTVPLPHFSWQGADSYQFEPVEEALEALAKETEPFTVTCSGLGIFTGAQPVVYLALVKDKTLLDVHNQLWERIRPFAIAPNMYYDPQHWVPHITLAFKEVEPERLGCAVADIAFQRIRLTIQVDHFALIYQSTGQSSGLHSRFGFHKTIHSVGDVR
jgi:2'-5' RNA ligase